VYQTQGGKVVLTVIVYFDGLCEPKNPGGYGAFGFVIEREGAVVKSGSGVIGWGTTNNVAEYTGAIESVKVANEMFPDQTKILRGDSQLVIRQVNGEYAVRSPRIIPLFSELKKHLSKSSWRAEWVPREQNEKADNETRDAVWKAIGKYPVRGRLLPERPDRTPPIDVSQSTLF